MSVDLNDICPDTVTYECTGCGESEQRRYIDPSFGGTDGSARVAGWRLGPGKHGDRVEICPECSGDDEDYWNLSEVPW